MPWRQVLVALLCTVLAVQSSPCSWVEVLSSWSQGYKAVVRIQVNETVDHWDVDVEFSESVINFAAWKGRVNKISDTHYSVSNNCYNNVVYWCQCFELPYLVRHESMWEGKTTFKFNGERAPACEPPSCDVGKVYVSDLEKAINYSIVTEIANQWNNKRNFTSTTRLNELSIYLELLEQHLPISQPIKNFLKSLREWSRNPGTQVYQNKVEELLNKSSNPFEHTPRHYKGCKVYGNHTGYTCALWTLFHSLTVAAGNENAITVTTVANAVSNYIKMFFTCDDCVKNFKEHEQDLVSHPTSHDQTIVWLWAVHNLANKNISGKEPGHIQWPSPQNCPNCHQWDSHHIIQHVNGTWNQSAVLFYINNVYSRDKMVPVM